MASSARPGLAISGDALLHPVKVGTERPPEVGKDVRAGGLPGAHGRVPAWVFEQETVLLIGERGIPAKTGDGVPGEVLGTDDVRTLRRRSLPASFVLRVCLKGRLGGRLQILIYRPTAQRAAEVEVPVPVIKLTKRAIKHPFGLQMKAFSPGKKSALQIGKSRVVGEVVEVDEIAMGCARVERASMPGFVDVVAGVVRSPHEFVALAMQRGRFFFVKERATAFRVRGVAHSLVSPRPNRCLIPDRRRGARPRRS